MRLLCGEYFLQQKCSLFSTQTEYVLKNYSYEYADQKVIKISDKNFYVSRFNKIDFGDIVKVQSVNGLPDQIIKISSVEILKKIGEYRGFLIKKVKKSITEPYATYILGLSIGYKPNLPADIKRDMQNAGIMHVLVVSGFNLGLIFSNLGLAVKRFGRSNFLIISLFISTIYFALIGFEPPILRAFFAYIYQLFESIFGLEVKSWFKIFFVNLLILNMWPYLIFDLSYQFTFMAVLGVDLFAKYNEVIKSILITFWMTPISSFYFGFFTLNGLLSIPIVILCIPLATFLALIYIVLPSSLILNVLMIMTLSPLIFLINFLDKIDFKYVVQTSSISWSILCVIYIGLYVCIRFFQNV